MELILVNLLNGLSAGLLLFLLGAGLTLIFSMMGVLNFAHASFYMLGAYGAQALAGLIGFWPALMVAPLVVGALGAGFETAVLRRVRRHGPVPELLITFGLSALILEAVQLAWGRAPLAFEPPAALQGPAFTLVSTSGQALSLWPGAAPAALCAQAACAGFPLTRAFMMAVALAMLLALWALLKRTRIGLVIRASLTHPAMVQALGHDLSQATRLVFGVGCGLAALAGVVGGISFVTEPAMAAAMGPIIFVAVVIGGLGSLGGAFVGALLVGLLQTLPLTVDASLADALNHFGARVGPQTPLWPLLRITLAQAAPLLPYGLLVGVLALRPQGLLGNREG